MFELFYWRGGGHGGPYASISEAVQGAVRYLRGMPYDETVIIHSRACDACHGHLWLTPMERCTSGSVMYIHRTLHTCNCGACDSNGREIFYKVRV